MGEEGGGRGGRGAMRGVSMARRGPLVGKKGVEACGQNGEA